MLRIVRMLRIGSPWCPDPSRNGPRFDLLERPLGANAVVGSWRVHPVGRQRFTNCRSIESDSRAEHGATLTIGCALQSRSMRKLVVCACLAPFSVLAGRDLSAQAMKRCRAADDSSYDMTEMIKTYALAVDSEWVAARDSMGIPGVASAKDIQLITTEASCRAANAAYQAVAKGARQTLTGHVYVLRVGAVFVVWDPGYRYDPTFDNYVYMVFSPRWTLRSIF